MQAVILAGGKGTRLKPYTTILPKPLMPLGDLPILEIIIRQLKTSGVTDIVLAVGYLSELLRAYFGNGEKWGVNITYSYENEPLGTAAPLKLIQSLEDNFLVMNGDILANIDYNEFFRFHRESGSLCTIATYDKEVKIDLGVLDINENHELTNYTEKPKFTYSVSMGIYSFRKEAVDYIPKDAYFDFPELIKVMIRKNIPVKSYKFNGYWLDIGRQDDYAIALDEFEAHKSDFLK
ncbi:MAG: NTP transferase domain-containing protein [Bacteroidetes bacterium]|nr:NTP transferase domain-containing protein [Bacteroidota bacterium]